MEYQGPNYWLLRFALDLALEKRDRLDTSQFLDLEIKSDFAYAVGCMTKWIDKWRGNGWKNARGLLNYSNSYLEISEMGN